MSIALKKLGKTPHSKYLVSYIKKRQHIDDSITLGNNTHRNQCCIEGYSRVLTRISKPFPIRVTIIRMTFHYIDSYSKPKSDDSITRCNDTYRNQCCIDGYSRVLTRISKPFPIRITIIRMTFHYINSYFKPKSGLTL